MTTGALEVTTLQLRFYGGGGGGGGEGGARGPLTFEGMPDDHWSSRGDDRGRSSISFC